MKNWQDLQINVFLTSIDKLIISGRFSSKKMLCNLRKKINYELSKLEFEDLFDRYLQDNLGHIVKEANNVCGLLQNFINNKNTNDECGRLICNYLTKYGTFCDVLNRSFYRVVRYFEPYTIADLCHKKSEITEGRYNKDGRACSYLSEHAMLAWIEARKPNHLLCSEFNVSNCRFLFVNSPRQFIDNCALNCLGQKGLQACREIEKYLICLPIYALMSISTKKDKKAYKLPQMIMEYLTDNLSNFSGIAYFNCQKYVKTFKLKTIKFQKYNLAILSHQNDIEEDGYSGFIKDVLNVKDCNEKDIIKIKCRRISLLKCVIKKFKEKNINL